MRTAEQGALRFDPEITRDDHEDGTPAYLAIDHELGLAGNGETVGEAIINLHQARESYLRALGLSVVLSQGPEARMQRDAK